MDGVWVEKQNFDILLMGRKQFKQAYEIDVNSPKFGYSSVPGQRYLTRDVRVGVGKRFDAFLKLFCSHGCTLSPVQGITDFSFQQFVGGFTERLTSVAT